jgi:hypothetical protein
MNPRSLIAAVSRAPARVALLAAVVAASLVALGPVTASGQEYVVPPPPPPPPVLSAPGVAPLLSPFPTVRVSGSAERSGTRFKRFLVRSRVGSTILSTCDGARCPFRKREQVINGTLGVGRTVHVRSLERFMPTRTTLRVYVMKDGFVGKYTSIFIRPRHAPVRFDRCLTGTDLEPVACS